MCLAAPDSRKAVVSDKAQQEADESHRSQNSQPVSQKSLELEGSRRESGRLSESFTNSTKSLRQEPQNGRLPTIQSQVLLLIVKSIPNTLILSFTLRQSCLGLKVGQERFINFDYRCMAFFVLLRARYPKWLFIVEDAWHTL